MELTLRKLKNVVVATAQNPRHFPPAFVRRHLRRLARQEEHRPLVAQLGRTLLKVDALAKQKQATFGRLSSMPKDKVVPPLDRRRVRQHSLTPDQLAWRQSGVVKLPGFMPDGLIDSYCKVRAECEDPMGWPCPVPYLHVPELMALSTYPPLMAKLKELLSKEMALNLSLTPWVSTNRAWHQDDYLNPDFVNSWYAAVWIALEDIHPDSGPFQYVPGSHRWPILRGERVRALLPPEEATSHRWPAFGERFTTPALLAEIARTGLPVETHLPKRGDVLIWHGRLVHQGSTARVQGMSRRALISHYNALEARPDWKDVRRTQDGAAYLVVDIPLDKVR